MYLRVVCLIPVTRCKITSIGCAKWLKSLLQEFLWSFKWPLESWPLVVLVLDHGGQVVTRGDGQDGIDDGAGDEGGDEPHQMRK